ncbi:MAG TPA: hypothetical protein VG937_38080 [Polyangiaceae bacterium]|nr:hypothetical protein [Polyangiaceae bacterium]
MPRFTTLSLMILLAACSADEKDSRTRESFCQEWASAACSSAVVSACQASSAEACRLTQQGFCLSLVPSTFSDAAADDCLAAVGVAYADADLTGPELDTVLELGSPCNRIVEGAASAGETCTTDRDCKGSGGYECVIKGGRTQGTCQIPEQVGAGLRCAAAQQVCMSGFYCDGANCIQAKSTGEACTNDEECGATGWCGADGSCAARLSVDAACTASNQCASDLCYTFSAGDQTCVDRLRLSRSEPVCENLR